MPIYTYAASNRVFYNNQDLLLNGAIINNRANAILTNDPCTQSYIDNSLIPMVTALRGHPAIVTWKIFNEPEWIQCNNPEDPYCTPNW
jgi:hypothetical protein